MRERIEPILRIACLVLGALVVLQIARSVLSHDPLAHLVIPAVPTLAVVAESSTSNAPATSASGKQTNGPTNLTPKGTNSPSPHGATNRATLAKGTSAIEKVNPAAEDTGRLSVTNSGLAPSSGQRKTNSVPELTMEASTNSPGGKSNAVTAVRATGTNVTVHADSTNKGTAGTSRPELAGPPGRPPGGKKGLDAPPEILARVDRITDSEILGPVIRPLPMALLGIAGNVAFLRSANGQTGLAKEGEEVGGLKLLRIGVNRVLVEKEGQTNELTIFSGYGGETLLPK